MVKYLVENGADIHVNNDKALFHASRNNEHLEIVKYLVENGADIKKCQKHHQEIFCALKIWRTWRKYKHRKALRRLIPIWFHPEWPGGKREKQKMLDYFNST